MELDLGLDFSKAEAEVSESRKAVPPADYVLQVVAVETKVGKDSGRPYLNWQLKVINNSGELNGKAVYYSTPLPWVNPQTGLFETSGIGFLVDLTKALGQPWSGRSLETNNYIGLSTNFRVKNTVGTNGPRAEIEKVLG